MSLPAKRGLDPYGSYDALAAYAETARRVPVQFAIAETQVLAGTSHEIVAPCDGYIVELQTIVTAAVGTGGEVSVEVNTVAVSGLTVVVADSASIGDVDSDTVANGTPTARVRKGDRIEIIPASEFATSGALSGNLIIRADGQTPEA